MVADIERGAEAGGLHYSEVAIADLGSAALLPPSHIVDRLLPAGVVTLMAGHGGAGKSALALHLAACVAGGRPFMGLDTLTGRVLAVTAEDPGHIVRFRLQRICRHYGIDPAELAGQMRILDATQHDPALYREARIDDGLILSWQGIATDAWHALAKIAAEYRPRVILLDNASDLFDANENDRARVRGFVRTLGQLANELDAAVLLLAHVNKLTAGGQDNGQSYSGSTAWHNSVRSRLALVTEDSGPILRHEKANHGPRAEDLRLHWTGDGLLEVGEHPDAETEQRNADAENQRTILGMIADRAARGEYISTTRANGNAYAVLCDAAGFAMTKRDFWRAMDRLESAGRLTRERFQKPNRHTAERFAVTGAGLAYLRGIDAEGDA